MRSEKYKPGKPTYFFKRLVKCEPDRLCIKWLLREDQRCCLQNLFERFGKRLQWARMQKAKSYRRPRSFHVNVKASGKNMRRSQEASKASGKVLRADNVVRVNEV